MRCSCAFLRGKPYVQLYLMILCGLVLVSISTEDTLRNYLINHVSYGKLATSVAEIVCLLQVLHTSMFLRKTSVLHDHNGGDWARSVALGYNISLINKASECPMNKKKRLVANLGAIIPS